MPNLTKTIYGAGTVVFNDSTINYATVGTAEVIFEGYAINQGSVEATDFARFTDYTQNYNTVECPIVEMLQYASNRGQLNALSRALFSDYAENTLEGIVTTPVAVFDGYVVVDGTVTAAVITVSGNATVEGEVIASVSIEFLDNSSSTASITGVAVFRGNASNTSGSIVGNVSLFDNASNTGSVQGDIEVYDNASNNGSSTGDITIYNSITLNGVNYYYYSGTLTSGVTVLLNEDKTLASSLSGTDTIDGQSSNWSTDGSGILTYSGNNFYAPTITSISADDETPAKDTFMGNGGSFTLTVVADDGGDTQNISYQWQLLGAGWDNISGETQSTYSSNTNNWGNTAKYFRCVVTNSVGSAESNSITITPVDAYGTVISTTPLYIYIDGDNRNNGNQNTIADGNGGTTVVDVYPVVGSLLYTKNTLQGLVEAISQSVIYDYLADGNGGYTEQITYPNNGYEIGTITNNSQYSYSINSTYYYYDVKVLADGNGGYTLSPQYPAAGGTIATYSSATIPLPNNLPSYSYTLSYISDGTGGYTVTGYPTDADKLGTALGAGVIYAPNSAGSLTFNIGYWGDGMGGYTQIKEVVTGTYVAEDSSYTYVVNSTLDGCDSIPKE